jgi:tetratricopeptide (TPR) repeat protein
LEEHPHLVQQRDDLVVELIALFNQTHQSERALQVLSSRRFHPWEGGEGLVSNQYVAAHVLLGRELLEAGSSEKALAHFQLARTYPANLGEGKHLLALETHLDYFSGVALQNLHRAEEATQSWRKAAESSTGYTKMTFYKALAIRSLGRDAEAATLLKELLDFGLRQKDAMVKIDYFATSLPNFLLFDDDLQKRNRIENLYLMGLARVGLGQVEQSAANFREVLALDANHLWAQAELERLEPLPTAGS